MGVTRMDPPRPGLLGTRAVVGSGTAFELVASALMLADTAGRHRFDAVDLWTGRAREMDPADVRTFEGLGPHAIMNLIGLALESPGERSASDFLAHLASLPPAEVVLNAIGRYRRTILRSASSEVIERAVQGDDAARATFIDASWSSVVDWQKSLRYMLAIPADKLGGAITGAFQRWHDGVFVHEAARLAEYQARAAAALRAEATDWRVDALLRRVAPALEYVPPAGIELLTCVPISSIKPAILFLDHRMETVVLFTMADPPAANEPPDQLILLGKALGDPLRLQTLRALAAGPRTLGDLATELGVPRSSLSHHISILRAAGFITHTIDDGRWGRLTLRPDAIASVEPLFRAFLGGAPTD